MELRNMMICSIQKDDTTNKLMYYARDLDSQHLSEISIKEMAKRYPSDFLLGILLDNGHTIFSKGYEYSFDENLINECCPLVFSAIADIGACVKNSDELKSEITSHDLIVIPNLQVREMAQLRREIRMLKDGNDY